MHLLSSSYSRRIVSYLGMERCVYEKTKGDHL